MIPVFPFLLLLCGFPAAANEVSVEIMGIPVEAGTRMELFERSGGPPARWVRADGAEASDDGTVTLRGEPGRSALLILRKSARNYRLDGPFNWPESPGKRTFRGGERRTLRGSHPKAAALDFRLVGRGEPSDLLCESDGALRWQCLGIPADFAGRIVACSGGSLAGTAAVRPDAGDATPLAKSSFTAAIRVVGADSELRRAGARIVRPLSTRGDLLASEPGFRVEDLGDGILWLEGDRDAAGGMVELAAPGHATRRVGVAELPAVCAGTAAVELFRALDVRGTVSGRDDAPVASATVLARSEEPEKDPTIFGEATTNDEGAFVLPDLEPRVYRLLACHGELGCREERASPGEAVRIVPTADAWNASADRLRKLPLQTTSGRDGRFRIAAPEPGDYLVEVRGASGGIARTLVRRTNLPPPVTDLGDLRLSEPIGFTARVRGCAVGWLTFSGPLGGETSLPAVLRFRLDPSGVTTVELGEPGTWTAWATCSGENERVEPAILPDVSVLDGCEIGFERAGTLTDPR